MNNINTHKNVSMILAKSLNHVIGKENEIPWRIKDDMKFFVEKTKNKTVLMGRKTCESLKKPLKDRRNVVITSNPDFKRDGFEIIHSINDLLLEENEELVIIGGAKLYSTMIQYANTIYLTIVKANIEGDTFFEFNLNNWEVVKKETSQINDENEYECSYYTLSRIKIF
jgi:dihydrofolate reductase